MCPLPVYADVVYTGTLTWMTQASGRLAGRSCALRATPPPLRIPAAVWNGQRRHDIRRPDVFADHVRLHVALADADTNGFADANTVANGVSLRERYANGVADNNAVAQPVRHSEPLANVFGDENCEPDGLANAHSDANAFGQPDSIAISKRVRDWHAELDSVAFFDAIINAICDAESFGDAERIGLTLAVDIGHAEPFGHAVRIANTDAESKSDTEPEPQCHCDAHAKHEPDGESNTEFVVVRNTLVHAHT